MVHPCDKPCGNKTASGHCATTACINPQFSNIGTVQYGKDVQKRMTWGDKIRAMTDEELAEWMAINTDCFFCKVKNKNICSLDEGTCTEEWLSWLKSPAKEGE